MILKKKYSMTIHGPEGVVSNQKESSMSLKKTGKSHRERLLRRKRGELVRSKNKTGMRNYLLKKVHQKQVFLLKSNLKHLKELLIVVCKVT
jgi:hypothetical protein